MKKIPILFNLKFLWLLSAIALALALLLIGWRDTLVKHLESVETEYKIDLALSEQVEERQTIYQDVLSTAKLPEVAKYNQNTWIQEMQNLASSKQLALQELKPMTEAIDGRREIALHLVIEGSMGNLLEFLYQIATANNYVYVEQAIFSVPTDGSHVVRAQIVLAQM